MEQNEKTPLYTSLSQIYDIVREHLLTQGAVCQDPEDDSGICKYRHNGLKCAIGVLIPDTVYRSEMDSGGVGMNVDELFAKYPDFVALFDERMSASAWRDLREFLSDLQSVHDNYEVHMWAEKLEDVRQEWEGFADGLWKPAVAGDASEGKP